MVFHAQGSTRKVGPKKGIALDQTGYGAIQRVPRGAPEPRLTGPVLPWVHPERRNLLFWPLGLSVRFRCLCVHCTGPPPPSLARIPPQLAPGVAGSNGGPIPHRFSNWFYRYCAPPPRTLVIKVCQRPLQVHTVLQMGLQTEPDAIGEFFVHQDPPFGTKGTH